MNTLILPKQADDTNRSATRTNSVLYKGLFVTIADDGSKSSTIVTKILVPDDTGVLNQSLATK